MAGKKPPGQRALSQAEKDLWTHVTKDVTPANADNAKFVAALEQLSDDQSATKKRSPKIPGKTPAAGTAGTECASAPPFAPIFGPRPNRYDG